MSYRRARKGMNEMESLYSFLDKRVKIIDENGKEWHGYVENVESAWDNEPDGLAEDSIVIKADSGYKNSSYVEFMQHEVKSIEVEK